MKLHYQLVFIICLIMYCSTTIFSQETLTTTHIQNLFFSSNDFKKSKPNPKYFTNQITLKKEAFLTAHFTLEKPLVESLKLLAPSLSEEELLHKGNFQFTFLVDGQKVHTENLNEGAGTLEMKTSQLKHVIPMVYPEQIDFWGWFMWLKFMKLSGGQDVLTVGKHFLMIEVRPYLQTEVLKVGSILARGSIDIKVEPIQIDESLVPVQEIQPNSGWQLSNADFDHNKIEALNRKIAEQRFEHINSIIVVKENQLLIEEYFNGATRGSLHDARSVGKSFASTMLGVAIEEGYIKNEDASLKDFYKLKSFKNYSPKKDAVTLASLLTMSSGFSGDDTDYTSPGNEENMYPTDNWVKFSLDLPMDEDKKTGKDFTYFTAGVVLLGDIIDRSVPNGLVAYADQKLFKPLNIKNYKWQYTPQKVGNTAGGIQLRAIDFAKYGQLYKNKGQWNDQQILTKEWVNKSLAKQVSQAYIGVENEHYGYLFWNKAYTIKNKQYEVSFCSGRGGNKIFIFKDIPFVVVITTSAYNIPNAHRNIDKIMEEYILPAVLEIE